MFWSSHPVCIRCRLPRFCTFSILSILNLMWSWPFFYALLISQLSWFIPCKCSEFVTHILHSLPPHQLSLSYHGAYFTLTFPIPRKFLTSLTFYPQHPINLGAGSGSRRTFFLQCLGRSHIGLDRVTTNLTLTITKMIITRCMYVSQKDLGWVTFEGNFETLLLLLELQFQ